MTIGMVQVFQIAEFREFDDPRQVINEEAHVRNGDAGIGIEAI